jgi:DNA-binding HxlR family transcriptional regulator
LVGNVKKTAKKVSGDNEEGSLYRELEEIVGCKWSVSVLMAVRAGTRRPGALERGIAGISTKVLSERLRKLTAYGLLEKTSFPEVPPRTEYYMTDAGEKLTKIISQIHKLDATLKAGRE